MLKRAAFFFASLMIIAPAFMGCGVENRGSVDTSAFYKEELDKFASFLMLESDIQGQTNGKALGFNEKDPRTWQISSDEGVFWTQDNPKRVKKICFYGRGLKGDFDVSDFSELEQLICQDNKITSLNLKGCAKLKILGCQANAIESLDLSPCVSLTGVSAYGNKLDSIDLSKNLLLEGISIDKNNLKALDLSLNQKLKVLSCNDNKIQAIDLSNNPKITHIYISRNAMSGLTLPNGASFEEFSCLGNKIKSLAFKANGNSISLSAEGNGSIGIEYKVEIKDFSIDAVGDSGSVFSNWSNNGKKEAISAKAKLAKGADYNLKAAFK